MRETHMWRWQRETYTLTFHAGIINVRHCWRPLCWLEWDTAHVALFDGGNFSYANEIYIKLCALVSDERITRRSLFCHPLCITLKRIRAGDVCNRSMHVFPSLFLCHAERNLSFSSSPLGTPPKRSPSSRYNHFRPFWKSCTLAQVCSQLCADLNFYF